MRFRTDAVRVILFGAAYAATGIVASALPASFQGRTWRLAAWGVSLLIFGAQLAVEHIRLHNSTLRSALHASLAVALGALLLSAAGPVRAHWGTDTQQRALLSLVLWPVLTGLPSFLAALIAGSLLRRSGALDAAR